MTKVVIGDTSAIIQLAIISPSFFVSALDLEIVVHAKAMVEIQGIYTNPDANEAIKPYLKYIIDNVRTNARYTEATPKKYIQMDQMIQAIESGMSAPKSAPTDKNDRFFLILAKHNHFYLCTREGTLYSLAKEILGLEKAWGVSDVINYSVNMSLIKRDSIQEGLNRLTETGETLHRRCKENLKDIGYKIK